MGTITTYEEAVYANRDMNFNHSVSLVWVTLQIEPKWTLQTLCYTFLHYAETMGVNSVSK